MYSRVKAEAKKKVQVYPSAYANAWLVELTRKEVEVTEVARSTGGLTKWFENWVDIGSKKGGIQQVLVVPKAVVASTQNAYLLLKLQE